MWLQGQSKKARRASSHQLGLKWIIVTTAMPKTDRVQHVTHSLNRVATMRLSGAASDKSFFIIRKACFDQSMTFQGNCIHLFINTLGTNVNNTPHFSTHLVTRFNIET